ncbi:MAG: hypothetical protein Q8K11_02730 [Phenylobacterium sp.]|uniref:hypothetical protein n=1 Tax=Phenylobacterium sp. TaxID=1871053 RepID=UPI002731F821|nr:hypothetical protein [Phenylobacterium sp.]MDP2009071.1 hypothetical protein [Phenylobacterium sp.]
MPPQDVSDRPPLHPIRESVGFVMAALGALAAVFWPAHRRRPPASQRVVPVDDPPVTLKARVAPFPIED